MPKIKFNILKEDKPKKEKKVKEDKPKKEKKIKPERPQFKIETGVFIVDFK